MSQKNLLSRIGALVSDPRHNFGKVYPYVKSRLIPIKRKTFELFGNEKFSKPYSGHNRLLDLLKDKCGGFFVEVGGNDGYFLDPTYYLEKFRGWTGIIFEPLPQVARLCRKNRRESQVIEAALVSAGYPDEQVSLIDCNAMSVVKGGVPNYESWVKEGERCQKIEAREITVPALTLDKALERYFSSNKTIDLLTIDVEGYELEVLKGLNLEKYAPKFILIEILKDDLREKIEDFLNGRYDFIEIIGDNDFLYLNKTAH